MQLRKIAAVLVSTLMVGSVFAGGPDMMAPAPAQDWAGYYAGVDMGAAWANEQYNFNNTTNNLWQASNSTLSNKFSGFIGGVHAGKNWQYNHWVWGVETGIDGASLSNAVQNTFLVGQTDITTQNKVSINWLYTLTPRLGYTFCEHWLLVGKMGLAATNLKSEIETNYYSPARTDSESQNKLGLDVGLGLDYMLKQWVFGVGYDYLYFGTTNFGAQNGNANLSYNVGNTMNVLRANVDYKFNV